VKLAPLPGPSLAARIVPPCRSTKYWEIPSPRPSPRREWDNVCGSCSKRSKILDRNSGVIPTPLSDTGGDSIFRGGRHEARDRAALLQDRLGPFQPELLHPVEQRTSGDIQIGRGLGLIPVMLDQRGLQEIALDVLQRQPVVW
jgi:hypothetical protein